MEDFGTLPKTVNQGQINLTIKELRGFGKVHSLLPSCSRAQFILCKRLMDPGKWIPLNFKTFNSCCISLQPNVPWIWLNYIILLIYQSFE